MEKLCLTCGTPLPEGAPTGRPSDYCGPACRRAAEYELRRINRYLEGLERDVSFWRQQPPDKRTQAARDQKIAAAEAEIRRYSERMRALLVGGAGVSAKGGE